MTRVRILTWNLWFGLNPYERIKMSPMQSPREAFERYARQLEVLEAWRDASKSDADFICLQEVNPIPNRFEELSEALDLEGGACLVNAGFKVGGIGLPVGLREGLATFVGEACSNPDFEQVALSGGAMEFRNRRGAPWLTLQTSERRKALVTQVRLGNLRIGVVNLHLHHGPDTRSENLARKKTELDRLESWLLPRSSKWDLAVICGDFNCDPDSPCLEPLKAMGFESAAVIAGSAPEPTWAPDQNPFARLSADLADTPETRDWDGSPHVFDRIYLKARRPVRVTGHHLLREPGLSDHFGVWTEFEVP